MGDHATLIVQPAGSHTAYKGIFQPVYHPYHLDGTVAMIKLFKKRNFNRYFLKGGVERESPPEA